MAGSAEDRPRAGAVPDPSWAAPRAALGTHSLSPCPLPGISNEAQFVFTIQSIVMAQKLKGTLSFIAKVTGLEAEPRAHGRVPAPRAQSTRPPGPSSSRAPTPTER